MEIDTQARINAHNEKMFSAIFHPNEERAERVNRYLRDSEKVLEAITEQWDEVDQSLMLEAPQAFGVRLSEKVVDYIEAIVDEEFT